MPIEPAPPPTDRYIVVARRYRPQDFANLIGQEPLVRTLCNAIETNRVGHAYLFTGSRGVGKTSAARIFAKALNCSQGPTITPCNTCDSCQAVSTGDDVDVLEIDGASNRGIDEIRQLRANVGIRPSRSRYKIYIIDEVHMLSRDAFNALLKTLEEPPAHVKFIFCTTDVEKVPVTVLSRCQRFDFAPIAMPAIEARLAEIVHSEGAAADPAALKLIARRAEGSLRDSQSLLEQILSAVDGTITVETVHKLLGTAPQEHVGAVMEALIDGQPREALQAMDIALARGIDAGQFCEQLLTMTRDAMVVAVGCESDLLMSLQAEQLDTLTSWSSRWTLPRILSAMQILEQASSKMRTTSHRRALLEMALVQIAHLDNLVQVADLAAKTMEPNSASTVAPARVSVRMETKKKTVATDIDLTSHAAAGSSTISPVSSVRTAPGTMIPSSANVESLWRAAIAGVSGVARSCAEQFQRVEFLPPDKLQVVFAQVFHKEQCDRPDRRKALEQALSDKCASPVQLVFLAATPAPSEDPQRRRATARERESELAQRPLVRQAVDLFDAEITRIHWPESS